MATLDNPRANSSAWSLVSAMSRLLHDKGTADITLTAGEKEWRLHSAILAIRSPFFKTEINNIKTEKVNMKMEIKDLNPEGMQQVINFMYGKPIGHAPLGSLLEASERFQMADMKTEVIRIASESISFENAVKIGKLGDLYNIEKLLTESAEFIVQNNIEMKEDDLAPKLTTRVLGIYRDSLKSLQNEMEHISKKRKICTCDSLSCCTCISIEDPGRSSGTQLHKSNPVLAKMRNDRDGYNSDYDSSADYNSSSDEDWEEHVVDLIKLMHGNHNTKTFLAKEFKAFLKRTSDENSEHMSERGIREKMTEISDYDASGRFWLVKQKILDRYRVIPTVPNDWQYILELPTLLNDKVKTSKENDEPIEDIKNENLIKSLNFTPEKTQSSVVRNSPQSNLSSPVKDSVSSITESVAVSGQDSD